MRLSIEKSEKYYIKCQTIVLNYLIFFSVRLIGLEPTQPELPDPKSGASTNFATGAGFFAGAKIGFF